MSAQTRGRYTTEGSMSILSSSAEEVRGLIAKRAYELYEQRAGGPGNELTDWLTAEQEVSALLTSSAEIPKDSMTASSSVNAKNGAPRKTARGASVKVKSPSQRRG